MCYHFCFASIVVISVGIASFAVGITVCAIPAAIKKYKSIIKKKKKKHHKVILLAKTRLIAVEVFVSKALISSEILVAMNLLS